VVVRQPTDQGYTRGKQIDLRDFRHSFILRDQLDTLCMLENLR
jgi:hypothetical protein